MSLADRLRHNLTLKLVSLVIALVIWGTVRNEADPFVTRQQVLRVAAISVPDDLAVAAIEPTQVSATLYGRRSALERLEYSEFRLIANMAGAGIGTVSVTVEPEALPGGIEIRHTSNRKVKVSLDAVVIRTRPVFVQTRGEPAPGVMVTGSQVRPHEVTVSGPSSEVSKVARVLAPVDVSGRDQTAPVTVDLLALDPGSFLVSGVKIQPPQAVVIVQMRQVNTRTVPVAPVISQVPDGYEVASVGVRPVVVTISGQTARIAAIEAIQTAPVDLTDEPGKTQYMVPLQTPAGITVLATTTVRVTVTLRKVAEPKAPAAAAPEAAPTSPPGPEPKPPAPPPDAEQTPPAKPDVAVPNP